MIRVFYGVVSAGGELRRTVYKTQQRAERWATRDGDSVVELTWDSEREPLYINREILRNR
jgi:hypothetical protein